MSDHVLQPLQGRGRICSYTTDTKYHNVICYNIDVFFLTSLLTFL